MSRIQRHCCASLVASTARRQHGAECHNISSYFDKARQKKTEMDVNIDSQVQSERLTLNISGAIFEIREEQLRRCPNTLLGCSTKRSKFYDPQRDEYFFDRHRQAFEGILFYYQSDGRLVCPENVPDAVFEEEVKFFQLLDEADDLETLLFGCKSAPERPPQPAPWCTNLRDLFEMPDASLSGKILFLFSHLVLLLSIAGSCLSTVDSFQVPLGKHNASDERQTWRKVDLLRDFWVLNDIICHGWFTLECAVRFFTAPNKKEYLKSLYNVIDLATIFTFYFILIVRLYVYPPILAASILLRVLQTLSLTLRILRLVRYSELMRILLLTFATGLSELSMLMMFVIVVGLLASSAVFYAETHESFAKANFTSIPDTFWWSVITITTIGYGDQVPATASGKAVAGICMVLGTLIIALPLFRFASQFRILLESMGIGCNAPKNQRTASIWR